MERCLHDILWAVHDGKNRGRSEGGENIGVLPVMVGGRGQVMRVSLVHNFHMLCCYVGVQ